MSGYLGGGGGGVTPGDIYQDWAIITVSGADWVVNTPGSWLTPASLTYTTTAKSNNSSYGSASSLSFPVSGHWRIHMRPIIINGSAEIFYGLMINSIPVYFSVGTTGTNARQGNDTLIHNATAGHVITPTMYLISGSATWQFTAGLQIYLELLKPSV